ncbi:hypothetical protein GCM10018790_54270 [Kitasatospora xanthocidica]|uniref:hypothetical protein n=1 Tax=Kitasatospora xanthocidica TaxID=83382 RepID=UPI001674029A|nr:hypothetical protein [Kitasatospora xanthocidica]GHF69569.1 hypothetical protein GCM10018790_54270 [Kitasatospora xanthocidica]
MASGAAPGEAQRRLQRAILAGQSAGQSAGIVREANELLDPAAKLTPYQCLEVYRRGYRLRLLEAMRGLPGLDEMPHYIKFKRIADGVEPIGPVRPLPTDPKAGLYGEDEAATSINTLFNAVYCYVLHMLDVIYRTPRGDVKPGATSPRYHYERTFMSAMQGILVTLAETMAALQVHPAPCRWSCTRGRASSSTGCRRPGRSSTSCGCATRRWPTSRISAATTACAG